MTRILLFYLVLITSGFSGGWYIRLHINVVSFRLLSYLHFTNVVALFVVTDLNEVIFERCVSDLAVTDASECPHV
jgi:hypothetical protein